MDYLQLCAHRQQCGDFVHCGQQPLCFRSVRTVKSTLFTHSCRILISPLCTCHRLCHAIQSDLLSVWNMQGKFLGKLFYLYETVYFFLLSFFHTPLSSRQPSWSVVIMASSLNRHIILVMHRKQRRISFPLLSFEIFPGFCMYNLFSNINYSSSLTMHQKAAQWHA